MFKKLIFLVLLGLIGYAIFIPKAMEKAQSELEEAGAPASVLELFNSD